MFLSKKNTIYFNKPKTVDPSKPKRILGGWQDDQQQPQTKIDYRQKQQIKSKPSSQNLLQGDDVQQLKFQQNQNERIDPTKIQKKQVYYLNWDELDAKSDIQCEKKLVEEIVQPGGIRIKPSEAQLVEFFKESKGMETHAVGSLLLSKIEVNYPFQIKAKALYTIQFMVKKSQKYAAYFKAQSQKLRDFPQPEDNVDNYKKILKQTLNTIGINNTTSQQSQNEPQITFVDPGYNDEPAKKDMKTFISENAKKQKKNQPKKAIIGPGMAKKGPVQQKNEADDILGLDLLGTLTSNNKNKGTANLLQMNTNNSQNNNITFDQLLGNFAAKNNQQNNLI